MGRYGEIWEDMGRYGEICKACSDIAWCVATSAGAPAGELSCIALCSRREREAEAPTSGDSAGRCAEAAAEARRLRANDEARREAL